MDSLDRLMRRMRISNRRRRKNSDRSSVSSDGTGPDKKKFGYYRCHKCLREWQSANSWRDFGQRCSKCNCVVKAYKRRNLIKSNKIDPNKPHPMHLCEKCKKLGRSCVTSYISYDLASSDEDYNDSDEDYNDYTSSDEDYN
jgi:Zinc-binding domain